MSPDSATLFPRPNAAFLALRPTIPAAEATATASDTPTVGDFLHGTLRPILKLQNDLLLLTVADFVLDHHISLASRASVEQQRLLAELLARNTKLRYTVIGLITALFTTEEYAVYRLHRSELNRRLLELAKQRVLDQTPRLIDMLT